MTPTVVPLMEVLRTVPDVRGRHGRRHPLAAILGMACAAMLCGYRSYSAIAEWGRHYDAALVQALGFTHTPTPCAATLFHVFRRLDRADLEARLGAWAEAVLAATPAAPDELEVVAVDGKTLRGSRTQGAPGAHLLSVVSHRLGLTLAQAGVDDKGNEITALPTVLAGVLLEGRVITADAILTQREIAEGIVAGGGDYVMVVKENQPEVHADIALTFASPPSPPTPRGRRPRRGSTGTAGTKSAT